MMYPRSISSLHYKREKLEKIRKGGEYSVITNKRIELHIVFPLDIFQKCQNFIRKTSLSNKIEHLPHKHTCCS